MNSMLHRWLLVFICVLLFAERVHTMIKCEIGWGQRGLSHSDGISWHRTCRQAKYCFEAVTTDIKVVETLIDFDWDEYYYEYYIKG